MRYFETSQLEIVAIGPGGERRGGPIPADLIKEVQIAAELAGLPPEAWAVTALYKQVYADKEFYRGIGWNWPVPTKAYNPEKGD